MKHSMLVAALLAMVGCGGDDAPVDAAPPGDGAAIDGALIDGAVIDAPPIDGPPSTMINGCTLATATDRTGMGATTITFTSFSYTPPCIRVSPATAVTFSGSFGAHPLAAGAIAGGTVTPDPTSPIQSTTAGTTATFSFPTAGTFPYYCTAHFGGGMYGTIFVVP